MYGDEGSNTLGHIAQDAPLRLPTLASLGLLRLVALPNVASPDNVEGAYARLAERSPGKDSVTGHWELMGIVLDRPFPTFPSRVSRRSHRRLRAFASDAHRWVTSSHRGLPSSTSWVRDTSKPAIPSSTRQRTASFRSPRTKTSFRCLSCTSGASTRSILAVRERGLGRVIARPFVGRAGSFSRTSNRHDYAMPPKGETLLDVIDCCGSARSRRSARSATSLPGAA